MNLRPAVRRCGLRHHIDDSLPVECDQRLALDRNDRNDARLAMGRRGQVHRLSCERREFEFLDRKLRHLCQRLPWMLGRKGGHLRAAPKRLWNAASVAAATAGWT